MRTRSIHQVGHALLAATLVVALLAPASPPQAAALPVGTAASPDVPDRLGRAVLRVMRVSQTPPQVLLDRGFPVLVSGRFSVGGSTALQRAENFLARFADLYGLRRAGVEMEVNRAPVSDVEAVTFAQRFHGVPVHGGELTVVLEDRHVVAALGRLLGGPVRDLVPDISAADAEDVARGDREQADAPVVGTTSLVIFDRSFYVPVAPDPRLAWRVSLVGSGGPQAFVDADSGQVLHTQELSDDHGSGFSDWELDLEHANGGDMVDTNCFNPTTIDDEAGDLAGVYPAYQSDPEIVLAWELARSTYKHFHEVYGRHGPEGDDDTLELYVHAGVDNASQADSCGIEFGDDWVGGDVMVHEWTHAVTTFGHSGDPRSLSEHHSDVQAEVWDDDGDDWRVGEDRIGFADVEMRDMADPARDDMGDYEAPTGKSDWYANAGILNKAAWLIGQGGSHNLFTVAGIGRKKLGHLYYSVASVLPTAGSTFQMDALLTVVFAEQWADAGKKGFVAGDVCSVRNGIAAVGLGVGDKDCDGALDDTEVDDDADGMPDAWDNCNGVASQQLADTDGDGLGDVCDDDDDDDDDLDVADNCPLHANPDQDDPNLDGIGDACQDYDDDGFPDYDDNCPGLFNDQLDSDFDGEGNACEVDSDGDGFNDDDDNCSLVANPDQDDADSDDVGDACDQCPVTADDGNSAYTTGIPALGIPPQPYQPDSDGDGEPDACDPSPFGPETTVQIGADTGSWRPSELFATQGRKTALRIGGPPGARIVLPLSVDAGDCAGFPSARKMPLTLEGLPSNATAVVVDEEGQRAGPPQRTAELPTLELAMQGDTDYLLDIRVDPEARDEQRFSMLVARGDCGGLPPHQTPDR